MDEASLQFLGAVLFPRTFILRYYAVNQESFVQVEHQPHNTRHIITKHIDHQWDYLHSYWSFLLLSLTFLGLILQ